MKKWPLTLLPDQKVVEIEEGKSLLQALKEQNVYIRSSCGGHATCGECVIKVINGANQITEAPFQEVRLLGNVFHLTKERLSCQIKMTGPVTIDISHHSKLTDENKRHERSVKFNKDTVLRKKSEIGSKPHNSNQEERVKKPAKPGGFKKPKTFKT